ncbi:Hypothetical protein POVN_LOCUS397 [uncultured virus]|nr:Hypothetical protein POVN_LOCUS397 [uncultured virus]
MREPNKDGTVWPYSKVSEGRDLVMGVRMSSIGDGSCYYHSVYKCLGKLSNLPEGSPFLADDDFARSMDYLDVDYNNPTALFNYMKTKTEQGGVIKPEYLEDTYSHRQYLVDRWRDDLYRWFMRTTLNRNIEEDMTIDDAIRLINNDVRNIRMWLKETVLDPNHVRVVSTPEQASAFLDLLLGGSFDQKDLQAPASMEEVYTAYINDDQKADVKRLESKQSLGLQDYLRLNVVNNDAVQRMEGAVLTARSEKKDWKEALGIGMEAAVFTDAEAYSLVEKILTTKGYGLIATLQQAGAYISKVRFYDVVLNDYKAKLDTATMMQMLKGNEFRARMVKTIYDQKVEELKTSTPDWYVKGLNVEIDMEAYREVLRQGIDYWAYVDTLERELSYLYEVKDDRLANPYTISIIARAVEDDLSPDEIRRYALYFFNNQNWGLLAPLMANKDATGPEVLVFIDQLLAKPEMTADSVKALFAKWLIGDYLHMLTTYINARVRCLNLIRTQCGFDTNSFVFEPYTNKQVEAALVSSETAWHFVAQSVNPRTGRLFEVDDIKQLQERDPRTIVVNGFPLAALYVKTEDGFMERTNKLDPEIMRLKLNTNYFMADYGFHLRAQVYESNIRSIREVLPVFSDMQDAQRVDAGEDILPWLSRMLMLNVHIVNCYTDFVAKSHTYTSGDEGIVLPDTYHIFVNYVRGHYEPLGVIYKDEYSSPPRRSDIVTLFPEERSLIKGVQDYDVISRLGGRTRLLSANEFYRWIKDSGVLFPLDPVYPPVKITSELESDQEAEEEILQEVASAKEEGLPLPPVHLSPALPLPSSPRPSEVLPAAGHVSFDINSLPPAARISTDI